jgi:shikimate dehydrogenase
MYPEVDTAPALDYTKIRTNSFAYDLVYNPAETQFMRLCNAKGAKVCNGLAMLHHQADLGWQLFKQGLD